MFPHKLSLISVVRLLRKLCTRHYASTSLRADDIDHFGDHCFGCCQASNPQVIPRVGSRNQEP